MANSEFVGVDGCRLGWFSVGLKAKGDFEVEAFRTFDELLTYYVAAKLILVDVPIGLPEYGQRRECDGQARMHLGSPRSSSVFTTPTRQTVQLVANGCDYADASANECQITRRRITKQTFAICPKIAEVDEVLLAKGDEEISRVKEVHPEICFWALKGRNPTYHSKKARAQAGIEERKNILLELECRTQEVYDQGCRQYRRNQVARDDILDALVAAVTAYHGHEDLQRLPEANAVPTDPQGLPMEMVYWIPRRQT